MHGVLAAPYGLRWIKKFIHNIIRAKQRCGICVFMERFIEVQVEVWENQLEIAELNCVMFYFVIP